MARYERCPLILSFFGFKVVNKRARNLFKGDEDFGFSNFNWLGKPEVNQILTGMIHIV